MQNLVNYAKVATPIIIEHIQTQEPASLEEIFNDIQKQYPDVTKEEALFAVKISLGLIAEKSGYQGSLSDLLEKFKNGESVVFDSNLWDVPASARTRSSGANNTEFSDDDYRKFMDDVSKDGGSLGCKVKLDENEKKALERYNKAKELRKNYPNLNKWIDENGNWTAEASKELSAHMYPMEHLNYILSKGKNVGKTNGTGFSDTLFRNAFKKDRKDAVKRFLADHPDLKKILKENKILRPENPIIWDGAFDFSEQYTNDYYSPGHPGYDQIANQGKVPDTPSGKDSGATKAAVVDDSGTITYLGKAYTPEEFINSLQNGTLPDCTSIDTISIHAYSDEAWEKALQAQIKASGVGKDIIVVAGTTTVVSTDEYGNRVTKHYDKDTGEYSGKSIYNPNTNKTLYYNAQGELEGKKII